jgi:hypothetical protein
MKIGIVSDTHNRYETVTAALALLQERGIELILHCGDIEDVATVQLFHGCSAHFVFGNCDIDRDELRQAIHTAGLTLHEPFGQLELAGKQIAWLHGDDRRLMNELLQRDQYDYIFHGHTHHAEQRRVGRTLVVNPGALHRARPKTFAVLDLASGELESVPVE